VKQPEIAHKINGFSFHARFMAPVVPSLPQTPAWEGIMKSLTDQEPSSHLQPDAIRVAHDVNQAMFDVLTPHPVEPRHYSLDLIPRLAWGANEATWEQQLGAVFQAARPRYPVLAQRPTQQDVAATLPVPISFTHHLIVGRIFSPHVRTGIHHALPSQIDPGRDSMPSRQQIDFDVHRAIVQTLVPRRVAEDAYSVRLTPASCTECPDSWAGELSSIRRTLRQKYARLDIADVHAAAAATYDQPLANTKDRIVEEILGASIWFPRG
jgi:hypothetical protein